jgi:PAS domain S-box-containing protein
VTKDEPSEGGGAAETETGAEASELAELRARVEELQDRVRRLEDEAAHLRRLFESSPDACVEVDAAGRIRRANPEAERIFGYAPEELLGRLVESLVPGPVRERHAAYRALFAKAPDRREMAAAREVTALRKDGSTLPVEVRLAPLRGPDGWVLASVRDVRQRVEQRRRLAAALRAKETLLRELNHRVKNNLQVVCSLLQLAALELGEPRLTAVLDDAVARIRAMALAHEWLSHHDESTTVEVAAYLQHLIGMLERSHAPSTSPVDIELRVDTTMELPLDRAIPCGLIVHELVTNALEHAFPADAAAPEGGPRVRVRARRTAAGLEVSVADNGIGAPSEPSRPGSMGLELVRMLAAQVGGTVEVHTDGGTEVRVTCQPEP